MSSQTGFEAVNRLAASDRLPGMVTILDRDGAIQFLDAAGFLDRERGVALRPESILRIYSLTKPVTATAIMQL